MTFVLRSVQLRVECGGGSSCGNRVERHIDECCYATCCRCSGCCFKPLPFCSTWLVNVNMSIDETGHNHGVVIRLYQFTPFSDFCKLSDGNNSTVANMDRGRRNAINQNNTPAS